MKIKPFVWFILCLSWMLLTPSCGKKETRQIHYKGSYNKDFNDLNPLHLEAAKRLGITPLSSRKEAEKASRKMVEIETNKNYEVEKLTHSIPYLVPEAAELLETIGKNFIDLLKSHNAPLYKVKVTSVTRTADDIKRLQTTNINSSSNSAHLYGTTFDITWKRYKKIKKGKQKVSDEELKMALAMVLRDLQKQGKCYVKHEKKQGCFHITVR